MLDANEHAATKNMRPYLEIVRHRRKTRTNGSPATIECTDMSEVYEFSDYRYFLKSITGLICIECDCRKHM